LKEAYKTWQDILPHVAKSHRQTIGLKIDTLLIGVLEQTFKASYASGDQKYQFISNAVIGNDSAKFFLLVAWECKILNDKHYLRISKTLVEASKMLVGWKNYSENKTSALH